MPRNAESVQYLQVQNKGLYTLPNEFSKDTPPGAMVRADNVVITKNNIVEPRRGLNDVYAHSTGTDRNEQLFVYNDVLLAHTNTNKIRKYSGSWSEYSGDFSIADAAFGRMKHAQAASNIYFATSEGVKKLDSLTGTISSSGVPKALDGTVELSGSNGFITADNQVAWRIVWGIKDANNNLQLSSPSQRIILTNPATGVAQDASIVFTIPSGITTSHFYQLYRSPLSGGATISPTDELQLVYESNPTSGEITAKLITVVDIVPDALRGATLYTSPSQEGIAQSNDEPPFAKDLAVFKNHMLYANTKSKQRKTVTLLAVGSGATQLQDGDTVDVGANQYTAKGNMTTNPTCATDTGWTKGTDWAHDSTDDEYDKTAGSATDLEEDISAVSGDTIHVFFEVKNYAAGTLTVNVGGVDSGLSVTADGTYNVKVDATGTGNLKFEADATFEGSITNLYAFKENLTSLFFSTYTNGTASQNVRDTATSLCRVINRNSTNTLYYAYYMSGVDDLPGEILIEARSISTASFALVSSRAECWNPELPTSGASVSSSNDDFKHYLYWSKTSEFEAVPLLNYQPVGDANSDILRVVPLRDAALIFKDDGVFRLTGEEPSSFLIEPIDTTTKLLAPDTAQVLNNQVYCLTDQGVTAFTDTGGSIMSRNIEDTLIEIQALSIANLKKYAFAVPYETDRHYILHLISTASDTYATQTYVYNFLTNAWTRWTLTKKCGIVNPADNLLYYGDADSEYISLERKAYTYKDHVDGELSKTVSAVDGTTLTLNSVSDITAGDLFYESATKYSTITNVDLITLQITVADDLSWAIGSATILLSINCDIEYSPQAAQNAAVSKHWLECLVLFKNKFFYNAEIGFTSDISFKTEYVDVSGSINESLWGLFTWGGSPWGGFLLPTSIRTYVPLEKSRGSWLKVRVKIRSGYCQFGINGLNLFYNQIGERIHT